MNILKIKDPQGNWVDIPALKGEKGDKGDPGISPTIDSTLSQANQAADAKAVGDKIDKITLTIDETLTQSGQVADAKVTGDILNIKADQNGYYENLNVGVADQLASKNYIEDNEAYTFRPTANGAKVGTREFDMIVGGSVVWNQGIDAKQPFTLIKNSNRTKNIFFPKGTSLIIGHKYLLKAKITNITNNSYNIGVSLYKRNNGVNEVMQSFSTTNDGILSRIFNSSNNGQATGESFVSEGQIWIYTFLNSNDNDDATATFSDFVYIDLTQMFGSEIADHIYSLEQASTSAGVAWFRKYFPNDYYDYNPGELMHVSGVSAHKTYDADENVIGNYPLDSSLTLRGVPKLVDGKLSFDGDIYKPDGTVERRYGIVDLGTLNWTISESTGNHFSLLPNGKPNINTRKANARCSKYTVTEGNNLSRYDYSFAVMNDGNGVGIRDKDLTGIAVADFKAAMSGVYVVYELATSTTEEAEPFQSPQILDPYGTEEYVTTSLVPVGHETKYPENLRAKIEGLPWNFASLIAPVETEFKATRNYTSGSLFIVDNTLYKATANIANGGTITPNTNCTATTLAEIIATL